MSFWQAFLSATAVIALIGIIAFWWLARTKASALLKAALEAQLARESHELDLDKRLGPKAAVEIAAAGSNLASSSASNLRIAYRQCGLGPDILCVHGIGASMMIYRRLAPWLAGDFRITCIDLPGFGFSDKPRHLTYTLDEQAIHLARVVEALKLEAPLVVASSMGGAITLKAALDHPNLFRGIMALAPAVDPRRVPMALLPLAKLSDHLHRMNTLTAVRTIVQQVIARRELITPALIDLYQEPFRDQGDSSSAFLKAFALLADNRMPGLFRKITTPLLIVRGLRDRLVKQAACEDLSRLVPHSVLITHPSAGHHIMEDEPEFIAAEVRKFDATLDLRE